MAGVVRGRPAPVLGDSQVAQQQQWQVLAAVRLSGRHDVGQRSALTIYGVVDLRSQPAAGTADGVPGGLSMGVNALPAGCGLALLGAAGVGGVLVGPGDGGVHRHPPVDQPAPVRVGEQDAEHAIPSPVGGPAVVTGPHGLPGAEPGW